MTAKTGSASTMHIGELADRTGLSLRTIRHYDDVGLLPARRRGRTAVFASIRRMTSNGSRSSSR